MAAHPKSLLLLTAGLALAAAAPPPAGRLAYEASVFLQGDCLSPGLTRCSVAALPNGGRTSASGAVLDAAREPRLIVNMAGLIDMGPQLTGGTAALAPVAP